MIKVIFFDVGYTLVNEDQVWEQRCKEQCMEADAQKLGLSPSQIMADILEATLSFKPQFRSVIEKYHLSKMVPYRYELETLYPEVKEVLNELASKYKLGIIANQKAGLKERLAELGIAEFFEPELIISSGDLGVLKPDSKIFEEAIKRSALSSCELMMIGDRIDNDVRPAKLLGMKTIWIKRGLAAGQVAPSKEYQADFIVESLDEIPSILYMETKMEIRELNANDLESLLELYVQLSDVNKNYSYEKSLDIWKNEIENNKYIKYFGAVDSGKVVATCYCTIIPNLTNGARPIGFIENVVTHEDYRRQGLAKTIIDAATEFAKANNCYKVFLESGIARTEAHKFYEKIGFETGSKKSFLKWLKN